MSRDCFKWCLNLSHYFNLKAAISNPMVHVIHTLFKFVDFLWVC